MNKYLIIGYGSISVRHIKNIMSIKKDCFFYILSRKKTISINFLNKSKFFHIDDIKKVNCDEIHSAFICTGANEHLKHINFLAKKKVNIFIEKPISNTKTNSKSLILLSKKNKIKIFVGYNLLYDRGLIKLKLQLINKKVKIFKVSSKVGYYLPFWRKNINYKDSVSALSKKGGGALLELSHDLHYLLWLLGRPVSIRALVEKASNLKIDVDDNAVLILIYKGFNCLLELDFLTKKYSRNTTIVTDKNTYIWDYNKKYLETYNTKKINKIFYKKQSDLNETYLNQLKDFFKPNDYKKTNDMINLSVDTLSVVHSAKISAHKKGKQVKINYA